MSIRSKHKSVKSEGEGRSWFGKIKSVIYPTNNELPPTQKRSYNKATEEQILKMFRLKEDNPNLSYENIAKSCDVSESVCGYYLEQKLSDVLANLKARKGRKVADQERQVRVRVSQEKLEKKRLRKLKRKTKSAKKVKIPTEKHEHKHEHHDEHHETQQERPPTESEFERMSLQERLDVLEATEKYSEEHLLDGNIYPDQDPLLVADPLKFGKRKRANNGLRKVYAVLRNGSESEKAQVMDQFETGRVKDMTVRHTKKEPRDHHGTRDKPNRCPCAKNEPEWVKKESVQTVDGWISKNHSQNQFLLNYRLKKEAEAKAEKEQKERLGTVAQRAQEGIKLCLKCDAQIDHSQVSRCQAYSDTWGVGKWYCPDHEPPVPVPKKKRDKK